MELNDMQAYIDAWAKSQLPRDDKARGLTIETNPIKQFINRLRMDAKIALGAFLNLFAPGFVRPLDVYDQLTRTHLKIQVSDLFTVISIDGRDFYFYRTNGKYDGSGTSGDMFAKIHHVPSSDEAQS